MVLLKHREDVSKEFPSEWGLFFFYKKNMSTHLMFKNVCFFCPRKMSICLKYNRDSENVIKVIEANKRGNHNGYTR